MGSLVLAGRREKRQGGEVVGLVEVVRALVVLCSGMASINRVKREACPSFKTRIKGID